MCNPVSIAAYSGIACVIYEFIHNIKYLVALLAYL